MKIKTYPYPTLPGWYRGEVRNADGEVIFETHASHRAEAREVCENWIEQKTGRLSARHRADMEDRSRFLDEIGL